MSLRLPENDFIEGSLGRALCLFVCFFLWPVFALASINFWRFVVHFVDLYVAMEMRQSQICKVDILEMRQCAPLLPTPSNFRSFMFDLILRRFLLLLVWSYSGCPELHRYEPMNARILYMNGMCICITITQFSNIS